MKESIFKRLIFYINILGLIIENKSSYDLEYVNCGYNAGYPTEPVLGMFKKKGDYYVIPSNSVGASIWRLHLGGNFGK